MPEIALGSATPDDDEEDADKEEVFSASTDGKRENKEQVTVKRHKYNENVDNRGDKRGEKEFSVFDRRITVIISTSKLFVSGKRDSPFLRVFFELLRGVTNARKEGNCF